MRTRLSLIFLFIAVAMANYLPFTPSAYWNNSNGLWFNQSTTYTISQTNSPDATNDYEISSTIASSCTVGGPWYATYWEMDHHILRATSNYDGTQGSAYDVVYDSARCGQAGDPHLYVYKVQSGSQTMLLDVTLAGSQASQPFTTFIRQDGSNPGIHVKIGFNEWHVSDTSLTSGYPGYGMTNGIFMAVPTFKTLDRLAPNTPASLVTTTWPTIIDLQWTHPTDAGTGVKNYLLYKNGTYLTTVPITGVATQTYSFGGLTPSTSYTLGVVAQDAHFNVSTMATTVISTTAHTPNIPIVPTRLGVHRLSQSWGASDLGESIDTLSGNVNFSLPVASIALRGGGSVPFALSYNAQLWRKDGAIVKRLGGDLGYGHGWRLQAGALTPIWNGSAFSHFVFTDATGAEYNLATNTNGVWTSKDGAYVYYDQNTRRLWFNSGIFWQMDCISGSTEVDAGSRYPTRIQNANGNFVNITYKPAIGSSTANTSARIDNLNDLRGQLAYLMYNADAIPHATNVTGPHQQFHKTFTYTAGTLVDPFVGGSFGSQKQLTGLSMPSTPTGNSNYVFTYNASGELENAKLPRGGELRYTHQTTSFANSISMREAQNRRLVKNIGGSEVTYNLVRDSADSSQVMHSSLSLTDPSGIGRKRWLFSTAADYTRGFLTQYIEQPTATGDSNILRRHTYTYTQDVNQMPNVQSVQTELDPGTADAKTTKMDQTVDIYGNVTQTRIYEYGNLVTPARTVTCGYYFPNAHYLRNLANYCNVSDGTNIAVLGTSAYDQYTVGNPLTQVIGTPTMHETGTYSTNFTTRGNPTTVSSPGKITYLSYNILGEVIKAVTNGQVVQWNYTSTNNFGAPTLVTPNSNSNLQTSLTWNSLLQPTGSSQPNGNAVTGGYDFLGRPGGQSNSDGMSVQIAYLDDVNQTLTYSQVSKVRTYLDGLGRPVKAETLDPVANTIKSTVETEYDSCACSPAGKMKRQSLPYAPGGTVLWTNYVYDGLGRTLQVIQPHTSGVGSAGTTTYAYAGNKVTVTDPAGRLKSYIQNALGNLIQVTEPNPAGGADYQTYYTYNVRDQLTLVQMPRPDQIGGTYTQTRTFVYDLTYGWLTSATNPENGTTTYNYNTSTGLLNYKQDAKGQKIEYLYDANNRVTRVTPKATGGTVVTCDVVDYFYDLTPNTYGRLGATQWGSTAYNTNVPAQPICPKGLHREEYVYTNAGRAVSKTLKLTRKFPDLATLAEPKELTAELAVAYEYNSAVPTMPNKVTYPTTHTQSAYGQPLTTVPGAIYQYTFDNFGRPTGETRKDDPSLSAVSLVDQVTYNTFGAMTQLRQILPSSTKTETRAYDSFQRLTSMTTLDGTSIAYNYSQTANDGKLVSQTSGAETINYTYDTLGRLSQAATAGAGGWGMSWTYDGWGNRLQQSAVKGAVPTMVSITDPATNRIQAHTYDANGNTTNTPQQGAMTYDVFNRLKTVASDSYEYDPGNKRTWKNNEYTFWGASGERIGRYQATLYTESGSPNLYYYFRFQKMQTDEYFGGRRLTSQDRLGSVGGSYYPYGESRSGTVSNADSFATYYRDSTGLDYARNRYDSSAHGRFLTADSFARSATLVGPSSWNRYSYVEGDPINWTDRSGLCRENPESPGDCSKSPDDNDGGGGGGDQGDGRGVPGGGGNNKVLNGAIYGGRAFYALSRFKPECVRALSQIAVPLPAGAQGPSNNLYSALLASAVSTSFYDMSTADANLTMGGVTGQSFPAPEPSLGLLFDAAVASDSGLAGLTLSVIANNVTTNIHHVLLGNTFFSSTTTVNQQNGVLIHEILHVVYNQGFTHVEIADQMGIKVEGVSSDRAASQAISDYILKCIQ